MTERTQPDQCEATYGSYESPIFRCERAAGHEGSHSAAIGWDEDGKVDNAVTWSDAGPAHMLVGATDAF